jgi:hypothetical protein
MSFFALQVLFGSTTSSLASSFALIRASLWWRVEFVLALLWQYFDHALALS